MVGSVRSSSPPSAAHSALQKSRPMEQVRLSSYNHASRVGFEPYKEEHAPDLYKAYSLSDESKGRINSYLPAMAGWGYDPCSLDHYVSRTLQYHFPRVGVKGAVFTIMVDGKPVGLTSVDFKHPHNHKEGWQQCKISSWIGGEHQRKGIMSQVGFQLCRHLFDQEKVDAIFLDIHKSNIPSLALLKKFSIPEWKPELEQFEGNEKAFIERPDSSSESDLKCFKISKDQWRTEGSSQEL